MMQCNINATRWSSLPPRHADKNRVAKKWRVVVKGQKFETNEFE